MMLRLPHHLRHHLARLRERLTWPLFTLIVALRGCGA
jgi:hypothetical protein